MPVLQKYQSPLGCNCEKKQKKTKWVLVPIYICKAYEEKCGYHLLRCASHCFLAGTRHSSSLCSLLSVLPLSLPTISLSPLGSYSRAADLKKESCNNWLVALAFSLFLFQLLPSLLFFPLSSSLPYASPLLISPCSPSPPLPLPSPCRKCAWTSGGIRFTQPLPGWSCLQAMDVQLVLTLNHLPACCGAITTRVNKVPIIRAII